MAAGLGALHDERVDAGFGRLSRLLLRGDGAPDMAAALPQPLDDLRSGQPNVNETTFGRSRAATASFASQSSLVQRGRPDSTP